jgi:dephospho-CoA kinase
VVHPLVADDRAAFIETAATDIIVLEIPLLLETRLEGSFDGVAVVTVDPDVQRERVLSRSGMTEEKFETILARQMPNEEKVRRADFVIDTSTLEGARRSVEDVIEAIRAERHA